MLDIFKKNRTAKGMEIEDSILAVTRKEEALIEMPFKKKGLNIIWWAIVFFILALAARVFYLDFFRGNYYEEISKGNRIRSLAVKAPRGMIYDRFGKILARNIPSLDAIIIPRDIPNEPEKIKSMSLELAQILEMDPGNIEMMLESQDMKSVNPALLKENITKDQALIISGKINQFPGVSIDKTAIRFYENGMIFSHIIGYDGKITREEMTKNGGYLMTDYIGKSGLEKGYEEELRGRHGSDQVEVDSLGNIIKHIGIINPEAGNDLILNVDEELQKKIYDILGNFLEKSRNSSAAAVAIDPRNGGVLAMASFPSYDNNMFARGITNEEYGAIINNKNLPLFNRAIAGEYPPGSTIKPAVASAALMEKTITPETTVDCSGGIGIGSWHFGDWKTHGPTNVEKAISQSCDVFFYSAGGGYGNIFGLGMEKMGKYEKYFGFGNPTGIDLPNEAGGFIPSETWKSEKIGEKWYIGDSFHAAIGQGYVTATPLQLANYTAALANGGTLYSPKVVNRIKKNGADFKIENPEIINRNFIDSQILEIVREGMRQTVVSGTAQSLQAIPVTSAGKTGTAQFGIENKTHGWYISFAPFENPVIAMAVLVEGEDDVHSAVPVTKEIYDWYFRH